MQTSRPPPHTCARLARRLHARTGTVWHAREASGAHRRPLLLAVARKQAAVYSMQSACRVRESVQSVCMACKERHAEKKIGQAVLPMPLSSLLSLFLSELDAPASTPACGGSQTSCHTGSWSRWPWPSAPPSRGPVGRQGGWPIYSGLVTKLI